MTFQRAAFGVAALVVALALQISAFPHLAWNGVVPNLVLLVVVAAALTRGAQFAMVLGFVGGVLLDLAPPADHYAGRWALALVLVAWIAARARQGVRPSPVSVLLTVASASFVGTSIFALTGLLLRDPVVDVTEMLSVIVVAVVWDVLLTPFVLPATMTVFRRLGRDGAAEGLRA